jgi:membrane-associated phospholipid phosphatase
MTVTEPQQQRAGIPAVSGTARHPYRSPLLVSGGLFLLVLLIRVYIDHHGSFPGDYLALRHFSTPWLTESHTLQTVTGFFGSLGTGFIAVPLILLAAIGLWRRDERIAVEGLVIACVAIIANAALKYILGPTPDWVAFHRAGSNFPSGHTTFFTAVIGYLGIIAWRRGQREIAVAAALLVVLGGPSRVIAGQHLVGDVVAGYCLGGAFLVAALTWVKWRTNGRAAVPSPHRA